MVHFSPDVYCRGTRSLGWNQFYKIYSLSFILRFVSKNRFSANLKLRKIFTQLSEMSLNLQFIGTSLKMAKIYFWFLSNMEKMRFSSGLPKAQNSFLANYSHSPHLLRSLGQGLKIFCLKISFKWIGSDLDWNPYGYHFHIMAMDETSLKRSDISQMTLTTYALE